MTKTNLITGFLGSGKTTSILHLLANKPANEKWAVLVNEFGEVGIDGALLAESGALLKEIPGGCMCCVNGLPMQVGLNTLLRQGKPDRLLIEPTGLGHPKQILDMLTAPVYAPWIDLRATLCILDPRQLLDEKVVSNENFRDQLAAADVIVSNKADRSTEESQRAFVACVRRTPVSVAASALAKVISTRRCLICRAAIWRRYPQGSGMRTTTGRKKALPRLAFPRTSAGVVASIALRAITPAAGFLTLKPSSIPSLCLNGRAWRRLDELKASCVLPKGWFVSIASSSICILRRKTLPRPIAVLS
ncbi:metal chaperone [Klebsiella oxytoca]|nr:metal chaperone [Klebsiella oxytoca]